MGKTLVEKIFLKKCCAKNIERWTLGVNVIGAIFLVLSMFIPRWRVDPVGTEALEMFWVFTGFSSREYGLLQVRGTYSQSWSTLTGSACQFQTVGLIYNAGSTFSAAAGSAMDYIRNGGRQQNMANVTSGCNGSGECAQGFATHLWSRCYQYEKVWRVSIVAMAMTFLAVLFILAGVLVACLTNRKKTGGITFGLFIGGCTFSLVINIVWAVVSDLAFKKLTEDAWFPYPSLAIGYFLHLYGCLILLVASGSFGYIVLPQTFTYDPEQERIDKRNRRLQKLMANKRFMANRGIPAPQAGGMNFPPPPGFAALPPGAPPQFAQMQMGPPAGQGQDFGLDAPCGGGPMGGPPMGGPPMGGPLIGGPGMCGPLVGGPAMCGPPMSGGPPMGGAYMSGSRMSQVGPQPQAYGQPQEDFGIGAKKQSMMGPPSGGEATFGIGAPAPGNFARGVQQQPYSGPPLGGPPQSGPLQGGPPQFGPQMGERRQSGMPSLH